MDTKIPEVYIEARQRSGLSYEEAEEEFYNWLKNYNDELFKQLATNLEENND